MKNLIGVLVMLIAFQANAQDFNKVKTSVLINQYDAAKADYEKVIAKKPTAATTAEGYYWKAKIYSGLAKDQKNTTALSEVKKAIDEYITADASNNYAIAKENGSEPFFDLYLSNFKNGVAAFNEKNWKVASSEFDQAVKYSDIIFTQGWATSKQKFDTTSLLYAGFANQNANNVDQTMVYYKRVVDANIKTQDVQDVYKYILLHYVNTKDKTNFDAFLKLTEAAYPEENWFDYKSEYIDKNYTLAEKIKLYDEQVAANNISETECLMFGDAFIAGKSETETSENNDLYIAKAADAYKKAYSLNSKNFTAAFNAGIAYYNQYTALDEKVSDNIRALQKLNAEKPAAPKDPKKKLAFDAAFKAQVDSIKKLNASYDAPIKANVDAAIEWIEKAFSAVKDKEKLERVEKNVAGRSVDFLATLYQYKRDKVRGKDQKAYDALDAKFNQFDQLHDKYNN
jgi:hypothetical protein